MAHGAKWVDIMAIKRNCGYKLSWRNTCGFDAQDLTYCRPDPDPGGCWIVSVRISSIIILKNGPMAITNSISIYLVKPVIISYSQLCYTILQYKYPWLFRKIQISPL